MARLDEGWANLTTPRAIVLEFDFNHASVSLPVLLIARMACVLVEEDYLVRNWLVLHKKELVDLLVADFPQIKEIKFYGNLNL